MTYLPNYIKTSTVYFLLSDKIRVEMLGKILLLRIKKLNYM